MDVRKLAAAVLTCLCFGSIHAYGVLLAPVEHWLGSGRMLASLVYAIAVASLTAGVYVNGRLGMELRLSARLIASGIIAALGLVLASMASSLSGLLIGFGLMYGFANGIAYAASLSLAAASMPGRESQAIGLATAAYGFGAVLCAQFFARALPSLHVATLLLILASIILSACFLSAVLVQGQPGDSSQVEPGKSHAGIRPLLVLWFSYLLGAVSGLMVLAHAPAIAAWREGSADQAGLVSGAVSVGSVAGGYLGGVMGVWISGPRSIALPMLVQGAALASLSVVTGLPATAFILGLAGLCYGVLIAAIPAEVRRIFGPQGFAQSYGKVFSAWGIAGIVGPVTAGSLYDLTLGYGAALGVAAALSLCSCLFIISLGK